MIVTFLSSSAVADAIDSGVFLIFRPIIISAESVITSKGISSEEISAEVFLGGLGSDISLEICGLLPNCS